MRRAVALVAMAAVLAALWGWVGASASSKNDHRQERYVRLVVTDGWSVDNDPSGQSGGDLFGSSGELRRGGYRRGKFSSACTLSPPVGAQCQATLIFRGGGRIQLAGNIEFQEDFNRLSIVDGTGKFRSVRGDGTLRRLDDQGQVQHLHLTILR